MPCNYGNYPEIWPQIRKRILLRAENRCEQNEMKTVWVRLEVNGDFRWMIAPTSEKAITIIKEKYRSYVLEWTEPVMNEQGDKVTFAGLFASDKVFSLKYLLLIRNIGQLLL